jgi:uncharacterized Zn finger protein
VVIRGRQIATTFWGKAWCNNLQSYRDYEHRLPRGRSYVRNGAVLDLGITTGKIAALVAGSSLYEVAIGIKPLPQARWSSLRNRCAGQVGSLIELLEGRLSDSVMRLVTDREVGLFPAPAEIQMSCSCPDVATMCKHVAAVMFGVGARLDDEPQLLFLLRHVEQAELVAGATDFEVTRRAPKRKTIAAEDLGEVFGIEIAAEEPRAPARNRAGPSKRPVTAPSTKPRKARVKQ